MSRAALCHVKFIKCLLKSDVNTSYLPCHRTFSAALQSKIEQRKYDLYAAVCVERKSTIIPPLTSMEETYQTYLQNLEFENSLKSDFELTMQAQEKKLAAGEMASEIYSNRDLLDKYKVEAQNFTPASHDTHDDVNNNFHSLNRELNSKLTLLVKQNVGKDRVWWLPTAKLEEAETLRQAAEKAIKQCCGSQIKVAHLGNAPFGFHKYKYPTDVQNKLGTYGAKIWFMRAIYSSGNVQLQKDETSDYQWLTSRDLLQKLDPRYSRALSNILL